MLVKNHVSLDKSPGTSAQAASYPQARRDAQLVAQEVLDEYVIYDTGSHRVHNLNPTAAKIWQWCDGATSPEQLTRQVAAAYDLGTEGAETLLWLTLDRLQSAELMTQTFKLPASSAPLTRRRVLRTIGIAALLPVVYTLVAPLHAAAASVVVPCTSFKCKDAVVQPYANANCTSPIGGTVTIGNNNNLCDPTDLCGQSGVNSFMVITGGGDCVAESCIRCPQ
ncbi:MAG: PqqD family protein [Caldilineaceae bacterium]|nr:PqqD family protein [Caldilineaceae bacterium]